MIEKLKELYSYRDFFFQLLYHQLHMRYQGSVLGFFWTLLHPTLTFISFSIVFSVLNHWNLRDYGIYFFSGFLVWTFFSNSCLAAADSMINNRVFVTKVYSPKALFPLCMVAMNLVDLAAGMILLFVLKLAFHSPFTIATLFLPLSLIIVIGLTVGVSLLCAECNVFFRDFKHLLSSFLFIWFFFSPIVWKTDAMPVSARQIIWYNPAAHFLSLFQFPLWAGALPPTSSMILTVLATLLVLGLGIYTFLRSESKFYYYL
jgi:ABC-type polysaccharide/polyol phosphate export permease